MSKICSLDFLGKKIFDLDIISVSGRKLFSDGDEITPEILLSLYFKEFIAREHIKTPEEIEAERKKAEEMLKEEISLHPEKALIKVFEEKAPDTIEFDKEQAEKIMELSYKLGLAVGMSEDILGDLRQSAYYYKIGVVKFSEEEAKSMVDFERKQAAAGYDLLTLEMNMPINIAEGVRNYLNDYNYIEFDLNLSNPDAISFAHIIKITDYYDKLIKKAGLSEEDALMKMLQIGGRKFNIFILHKFIKIMRDSNG